MSQKNVELERRGMESARAFWALLDERIGFNMRLVPDADDVYVGREAAIDASRQYWGAFDSYRLDALELIDAGSSVVVVVRERGVAEAAALPSKGDGCRYGRP